MCFVYLLSYNGIPFYVGMTKDIVKRYIKHYNVRDCNSYDAIHRILYTHKEYVDILPICYCDRDKAAIIEQNTIKLLCHNKIKLANRLNNNSNNRIPEDIIDYKRPRFPIKLKEKLIQLQTHYKLVYGQ